MEKMTLDQAINEIETKWLNDNTTIKEIKEYYHTITGLNNLSTGNKLNYLYEYVIDAMLQDDVITYDIAQQLLNIYLKEND